MLVLMALCVVTLSCRKDSTTTTEPNTPVTPNTPTNDCDDPENTIVVNLRNDGGSVTMLGCQLRINNANNFVSDDPHVTFVNVGQVSGLGCVEDIPEAGWSDQVAVTSRNGYVVKSHKLDETTGLPVEKYARIFVVKYLLADNNGGIVGAVLKYQDNWDQNEPPTPPTPGPGGGSGTADDPYNVASGIALQGQEIVGWVQGYIVGAARNGLSTVSSNDDIIWSAPFDSYTNVLIADDPTCNEVSLCVIVNLPSGKPLRSQVNLFDNPDNLGKTLAVNGKLRTYFGQAGLRDSGGTENDFVLEGGTPTPPTPGTTIFSESFASGQGDFVIEDVLLPEELTYVWAHAANYSCMKASAYVDQAYDAESWLVSPAINLANVNTATLRFEQAVNHASPQGALSVLITNQYVDTVDGIEWTELQLSAWPAGTNWTFIASSADMTPYVGQTVNIAFKYTSTSSASATWEVKNVVIAE